MQSISESGMHGVIIDIECQLSNGLPSIIIIGFANKSVDEAKERIRSAFTRSKLNLPRKRITLNLAPADIPKEGTGYDLGMALSIMLASKQCKHVPTDTEAYVGELGLDGTIRPVRGVIGKLLTGYKRGITTFFIPRGNLEQALLVPEITVIPVDNLHDLYLHFSGTIPLRSLKSTDSVLTRHGTKSYLNNDLKEIVGQSRAKRALEIAAAGGHNVLLNGPPGTGKSMLAKALPSILPEMSHMEILEATHIHSLASSDYETIVTSRPFRAPHHSSSDIAIIGGGQRPRPGEISMSHHGILFFDELPEFSRSALEALRQPLEDRIIHISRAKETLTLPANFILVATSNPCPCGYYGTRKPCSCLPYEIIKYQRKISGPVLDRIDMYVEVDEVDHNKLLTSANEESSKTVAARVKEARIRQSVRFAGTHKTNDSLSNKDIKRLSNITPEAQEFLNSAAERLQISARNYMRAIKVARTIADLEGSEAIESMHIAESLQYRRQPVVL